MDVAAAERALHARARLACAAATAAGLPGAFWTDQVGGLRVVATTSPNLAHLNAVTGLDEQSAPALPVVLGALRDAGAPPPTVVTTAATPGVHQLLTDLGYAVTGVRPLALATLPVAARPAVPGVPVDGVSASERALFLDVLVTGYEPTPELGRFLRAEHSAASVRGCLARVAGEPVGAAALSVHDGTAVLGGACALPGRRGSGVQQALLRYRLDAAMRDGATQATATAAAGSASARNLARAGLTVVPRQAWTVG